MKKTVTIIAFFIVVAINAQTKTTFTYAIKGIDTLQLDIYTPKNSKQTDTFPTLLWMHGGGFSGGTRDNPAEIKLAEYAAKNGFVGISISYRLMRKGTTTGFGCDCPKEEKLATFKNAVIDYMDAALFVVNNNKKFQIDIDKIIAGGSSAGAEGILNAVIMREYFIKNLEKYNRVKFAGVFSLAGAMVNVDYITQKNAVPVVLFHGTEDNLVPYATAPHHYCNAEEPGYLILDGSATIVDRISELEKSYYFYSVDGGKHEISSVPFNELDTIFAFFNQTILNDQIIQTNRIIKK